MVLKTEDTEYLLKIVKLAAQSVVKEESDKIFARMNGIVEQISETANQVSVLAERQESYEDRVNATVRREVSVCASNRKKDRRASVSLLIAAAAFVYSVLHPWISGILE